ncbi:MAG: hypothetical protein GY841_12015 [FCB group bacterium]|nr:hypothetical protein [FCB group bacterium]
MRFFDNNFKSVFPAVLVFAFLFSPVQSLAGPDPCLEVSPDTIEFYRPLYPQTYNLDTQFVFVNNCGDGDLEWTGTPDQSWIGFSPTAGGNFDSVAVWIVVSGLPDFFTPPPAGDTIMLEGLLTFTASGAMHSPRPVIIRLSLVYDPPGDCQIIVNPHWIEHDLAPGDVITDSIVIVEADSQEVAISFSNQTNWLTMPVFFTAPLTPASIPYTINTAGLSPGIYYDTIFVNGWLNDTVSCGSFAIPVLLHVDSVGGEYNVETVPPYLNIWLETGEQLFDSLHVYETAGRSVGFMFENSQAWLIVEPLCQMPPYNTPRTLILLFEAEGMIPGTYIDTVFIHPDPTYDTATFASVAVPVVLTVVDSSPQIIVTPDRFDFNMSEGDTLDTGLLVYEQNGDSVAFSAELTGQNTWLHLRSPDSSGGVMPDSVNFYVIATGLSPGVYSDTIVVFNPLDDLFPYFEIRIPVELIVDADSSAYVVQTSPTSYHLQLLPDQTYLDSIYVYEIFGRNVGFMFSLDATWIEVDPFFPMPPFTYTTPAGLIVRFSSDSLTVGIYIDTIFIVPYPNDGSLNFFPVAVPVQMIVTDDTSGNIVVAEPSHLEFVIHSDQTALDTLHIYEIHGRNIEFMHHHKSVWLAVNPLGMLPNLTPMTMPIAVNPDTIPIGHYVDTITIYPGWGPYYFPPITVPVDLIVVDGEYSRGDANADDDVNVGDAVYVINFIFKGGPPPEPIEAADANCDGKVNVGDAVYLLNFIFKSGPQPMTSCFQ